jgi:hypothetical protein
MLTAAAPTSRAQAASASSVAKSPMPWSPARRSV